MNVEFRPAQPAEAGAYIRLRGQTRANAVSELRLRSLDERGDEILELQPP